MSWDALGDLLYRTLFDEAEELRGMFFNLTQARTQIFYLLFIAYSSNAELARFLCRILRVNCWSWRRQLNAQTLAHSNLTPPPRAGAVHPFRRHALHHRHLLLLPRGAAPCRPPPSAAAAPAAKVGG